jgi:UDP-glucose 4-epimerase
MSYAEPVAPPGRSLVLGAGGFLGSHVAHWLTSRGAPVRLFDLSVRHLPAKVLESPGCEVFQGNFLDETDLRRALEGVERVFHLIGATVPFTSLDQVDVEIRANVLPTVRLLDAMRELDVPLVIFPSSGGTLYGPGSETARPSHEEASLDPTCSYGLGKLLIEEILRFRSGRGGPDHFVLRISNPYGRSSRSHRVQGVINAFLSEVLHGRPIQVWGDGRSVRDFVYVDDVIRAFSAVLRNAEPNQTFNVSSGEGHRIPEVIELVREVTGRDVRVVHRPEAYAGIAYNVLDPSRIEQKTGWRAEVDLRSGIQRTWESMLAEDVPA